MNFQELNLPNALLRALRDKEYERPTPIQMQAIPAALEGRDILGTAQTGTGKTAAFALPVLANLLRRPPVGRGRPIRALILTPTRELALQIDESLGDYAKYTPLRTCVVFGGVNQRPQIDCLKRGVDVLTATPGRLLDLIGQGHISLKQIEFFVLDEADRMLDMGFIHDIRRLLPLLPGQRQTLLFSATMPKTIERLAADLLNDPVRVAVEPVASVVDTIEQRLCYVEKPEKKHLTDVYKELMQNYGRKTDKDIKAVVRITTSDVGVSGANIFYSLQEPTRNVILGNALKVTHKNCKGMEDFTENIESIFDYYREVLKGVMWLCDIWIEHPANAMAGIMKQAGFGKKLLAETVEQFKATTGDEPCSAYEIYCGICESITIARQEKTTERGLLALEEKIAGCVSKRWHEYDIPGTVKY